MAFRFRRNGPVFVEDFPFHDDEAAFAFDFAAHALDGRPDPYGFAETQVDAGRIGRGPFLAEQVVAQPL